VEERYCTDLKEARRRNSRTLRRCIVALCLCATAAAIKTDAEILSDRDAKWSSVVKQVVQS
jgi:hypothetical protein